MKIRIVVEDIPVAGTTRHDTIHCSAILADGALAGAVSPSSYVGAVMGSVAQETLYEVEKLMSVKE